MYDSVSLAGGGSDGLFGANTLGAARAVEPVAIAAAANENALKKSRLSKTHLRLRGPYCDRP